MRTCLLVGAVAWLMLTGVAKATTLTPPSVTGTPEQGQTLSVTPATPVPATATISDQWLVCTGTICTNGPTGPSFPLTAADVGYTIEVTETANDTTLPPSAPNPAVATSPPTAVVTGNSVAPSIAGVAQQGQILTLTTGTWTNGPTSITDQWESCLGTTCSPVGLLNSLTYQPAPGDVGHTIEVVETATNGLGTQTATSTAVGPVAALAVPAAAAPPVIQGTPHQGQTLTLGQGTWANNPASITDQWEDCLGAVCIPIAGQTGGTYTLGPGDVGHTIVVVETATNDGGPGLPAASAHTGIVTATSTTSVVAFSASAPMANQSLTLVATVVSTSGNANPAGSMTFLNGATAIRGCTGMGVKGGQSSTVVCQASFPAGTPLISAAYVPGPGSLVDGSNSAPTAVTVGRDPTSISLAVTTKVARGGRATYSATVVLPVSNSGPAAPTGSMRFFDRGHAIPACVNQQLTNLTSTCTVKYRRRGTHHISALYTGDANFSSSASPARFVKIVNTAPTVTGFVKSTLQWTFFYHPKYTQLILLKAFGIVKGTGVLLMCLGDGCPFDTLQVPGAGGGSISLLPEFRGHHLRAGTHVIVRLTHQHWVGKYYSFTMRAGRPPLIGMSCLAVGKVTPGVGC
jgi:Bacterial Ig-like domain (group 3)